nr:hypothetical protein [Maliibacterium massiliense]
MNSRQKKRIYSPQGTRKKAAWALVLICAAALCAMLLFSDSSAVIAIGVAVVLAAAYMLLPVIFRCNRQISAQRVRAQESRKRRAYMHSAATRGKVLTFPGNKRSANK